MATRSLDVHPLIEEEPIYMLGPQRMESFSSEEQGDTTLKLFLQRRPLLTIEDNRFSEDTPIISIVERGGRQAWFKRFFGYLQTPFREADKLYNANLLCSNNDAKVLALRIKKL